MKKLVVNCLTNETTSVDLTAEEISQREAEIAEYETKQVELEEAETAHNNLKASAKAKLVAGEKLTEAEANVLVGV